MNSVFNFLKHLTCTQQKGTINWLLRVTVGMNTETKINRLLILSACYLLVYEKVLLTD